MTGPVLGGQVKPSGLACDSADRLFVFSREQPHSIMVFDQEGRFVSCWGEGAFDVPHGIEIGPDDMVYLTDYQAHVVDKYSPSGERVLRLGTWGFAHPVFLRRPFNQPTGVAVGPMGHIYVSDGYANFVVHKFSESGTLLATWGQCGSAPGHFAWPHNIAVDEADRVYVCDRENDRIQVLDNEGNLLSIWTGFTNPQDICIDRQHRLAYIVESNIRALSKPEQVSRISIRNLDGIVLCSWQGRESDGTGVFEAPHSIAVDSHGDIYVAEIRDLNRIVKFVRVQ
jgi:DNA-binding beta-propeller fold protein YncE